MRIKHRTLLRIALCYGGIFLSVAVAPVVSAQTLYTGPLLSNTDQPVFSSIPSVFAGQWLAMPFLTGPEPARLDSVRLLEDTFFAEGSFWVMIYSDDNQLPGTVLSGGNLSSPAVPQGVAFQNYFATEPLFLEAGTRYWVVAASDNPATHGGGYGWRWTNSRDYTSAVGWSLYDYFAFTPDSGASWISTEPFSGRNPLLVEISGAIVPEPGHISLLALSIVVVFLKSLKR